MTQSANRQEHLDFLKAVFIVLMVAFHLVYFSQGYPYIKQIVYTFHMPAFLLISGYLSKSNKSPKAFATSIFWLTIPYLVMESGYVLMASILPINDHVEHLNMALFLRKIFIDPLGPYWFLHTLIICKTICYAVSKVATRLSLLSRSIIIGIIFYLISRSGLMTLSYAFYFLAGFALSQSRLRFEDFFKASLWSLPALAILLSRESHLHCHKLSGVLIVYMVISLCLFIFPYLKGKCKESCLFIGRNSLAIYLFSPIFTICCKVLVPLLAFDPTRLIFLVLSLIICICGSFGIAKLLDSCKLSPFLFGRDHILG
ncbi:MAG: acyltransferase family protein [Bacteroidales bacterium]|nr:acyltransferase family protein [Bacteroidales bacterium]